MWWLLLAPAGIFVAMIAIGMSGGTDRRIVRHELGGSCEAGTDCTGDALCKDGVCSSRTPHVSHAEGRCASNSDCAAGLICVVRMQGGICETTPPVPGLTAADPNPHANLCPYAAKRLLDKAYNCGFNVVGVTETQLCSATTYERVIYLESLNCRELLNLLAAVVQAE